MRRALSGSVTLALAMTVGTHLALAQDATPPTAPPVAPSPAPTAPAPTQTAPTMPLSMPPIAAPVATDPPAPTTGTEAATHAAAANADVDDKAALPQTKERPFVRSPAMKKMMARTTTWDLNVELGYGYVWRDPKKWEGFFRGGAGVLFVRDPLYYVLRFTYDYSPLSTATMGVELEGDWVEAGLWAQAGLMKDANSPYWGGRVSVGFAILGFEAEYRGDASAQTYVALYGKLRLPIGIIGRAFQ